MESLFYLAKVGLTYIVLYSVYFIFFRNNTYYQANRIYLLTIIPFAFLLPIINSSVAVSTQYQITLPAFEINNVTNHSEVFNWNTFFTYLYLAIASVLMLMLCIKLYKTFQTISKIKKGTIKEIQPFSFFSFIHIPETIKDEDREAILCHEKIHSTQLHSLDIIVYEISRVILWWNPFVWMGLNSVKSNHEFIADKLASVKVDSYSLVLVAQLLGVNCSSLSNNFSYKPLIRKRIMMMKTKKSNRLSVLKYALIIPIVLLGIIVTTNKEVIADPVAHVAHQGNDTVYDKVDVMPEFKGGMDALMKYLGSNIQYPETAKENKTEGIVFVSFVVDKKGKIKETTVLKSIDPLLDNEAIRAIESMPKWKPGKNNGKKVNVRVTLPIKFKLQ